jgi:hypothetical protein
MGNQKTKPMVHNQIHTTTDYFLFKPLQGNRLKNTLHLSRLKKSMQEQYLFTAILINEEYEIIDGQHRFECIKELGLPLHYIICEGYGLNEVQVLNQNAKNWNTDDFMNGYCDLGKEDYLQYRDFKNKYPFGHGECQAMLCGYNNGKAYQQFIDGAFRIKNLQAAHNVASKICKLKSLYAGYTRRCFVYAMIALLKKPQFDYLHFEAKLKKQPTKLTDCATSKQYISLIEDIYNYRRRDKINLRY